MDISATFAPAFQETESLEIDILTETDTELQQISLLLLLFLTKNNAAEKKFEKKTSETFGSYLIKFLPLHPLL